MRSNYMKDNIKKIILLLLGIFLIGFGLITMISSASYIFAGKTRDLNEIAFEGSVDEYENKFVSMDVDAIIDVFAQTRHTINGIIPTGTDDHYIVWLYDDSFIGLSADKNTDELDRVLEDTYDCLDEKTEYLTDKTVYVEGRLKPLKGELSGYYQETLNLWGLSILEDKVYLYTVDTTETRLSVLLQSVTSLIVGLVMLAIAFTDKINQWYSRRHHQSDDNQKETDTLFVE